LVSWDGVSTPWSKVHLDAPAQFDWVLFDYSGTAQVNQLSRDGHTAWVLSGATECKGEIFQALAHWMLSREGGEGTPPEYIGLIDDDIVLGVSDLNWLLHLARVEGLDVFSPVLTHDSRYTHRWSLQQPHRLLRDMDWVEVMMPFYRHEVFIAAAPYFKGNVSSWGIDKYLIPTMQQLTGCTRTALVDAVAASHRREVTSGQKRYRNGRTAGEEREAMKALCLSLLRDQAPHLLGTPWFHRVFEQRHVRTRREQLAAALGRPLRRWLDRST
jgi:hypothetical protein